MLGQSNAYRAGASNDAMLTAATLVSSAQCRRLTRAGCGRRRCRRHCLRRGRVEESTGSRWRSRYRGRRRRRGLVAQDAPAGSGGGGGGSGRGQGRHDEAGSQVLSAGHDEGRGRRFGDRRDGDDVEGVKHRLRAESSAQSPAAQTLDGAFISRCAGRAATLLAEATASTRQGWCKGNAGHDGTRLKHPQTLERK